MKVVRYWRHLDPRTRVVLVVALLFGAGRFLLATQSTFPWHQGWNEGHYAMLAEGFLHHPLIPHYGDRYIYNVPPLFPYFVALAFTLFEESTVVARAPSVLFGSGTIIVTYFLGYRVFGDRSVAAGGACLLATLPYFVLYSGRAQTDITMLFFFTASLYSIIRGYEEEKPGWLVAGGVLFALGFATKQPTILLAVIVCGWLLSDRRYGQLFGRQTAVLIAASVIGLLPLVSWFVFNYLAAPAAFLHDWHHELFTRTIPFANLKYIVVVGLTLGITPPVLGLAAVGLRPKDGWFRNQGSEATLLLWILLYGGFVLYRTPQGHQYYLVGLLVPLSLYASRGAVRTARFLRERKTVSVDRPLIPVAVLLVVVTIIASVGLVGLAGDYAVGRGGETVSGDAGQYITSSVPANSTVYVVNEYGPPLQWYVHDEFNPANVNVYYISRFTPEFATNVSNQTTDPVYFVYPITAEDRTPDLPFRRVYTTSIYRPTLSAQVGALVETESKFRYYLEGRGLVIYRVDSANRSITISGEESTVSEAL